MSATLISRTQVISLFGAATQAAMSIAKPAAATVGKTLILKLAINSAGTAAQSIAVPAGFTSFYNNSANNPTYENHVAMCWRVMDGTEGASFVYTFLNNTNERLLVAEVWDGAHETAPIGAVSTPKTSSSVSPFTNTLTTTAANSVVVFDVFGKGGTITTASPNYWPTDTTGIIADRTSASTTNSLVYAEAYQLYAASGSVVGTKTFTNLFTSGRYWNAIAYGIKAGTPKTIDNLNNGQPIKAGQQNVVEETTGLATITRIDLGGQDAVGLNGTNGDGDFDVPPLTDGVFSPSYGTITVVIYSGANFISTSRGFLPADADDYILLTDVSNATKGYLKYWVPGLIGNEQVTFKKPASLGVAANGIDADGRIYTDYMDVQTVYVRNMTTGIVTAHQIDARVIADSTPNNFTFAAISNAEPNTQYIASAKILGVDVGANVSVVVANAECRINGGAWMTVNSTAQLNADVDIRANSPDGFALALTPAPTLTLGGVSAQLSLTTRAADVQPDTTAMLSPNEWSFVTPAFPITGVDAGVNIPIVMGTQINCTAQYALDTGSGFGAFTDASGNGQKNHQVKVKITVTTQNAQNVSAQLLIGGVPFNFSVPAVVNTTVQNPNNFIAKFM